MRVEDALDAILLGCFFFGLVFTLLSLVLGVANVGIDHGHDVGNGHHGGNSHTHDHQSVTPFSVGTILAFLTWFGGVAYLARNGLGIWTAVSIVIGLVAGLLGGWLVLRILMVVRRSETVLHASEERLSGSLARVTSSIRPGGTGEIVYELRGVRQVSAARSSNGAAISRGTEVLVLKRVNGIAMVEPWLDALAADLAVLGPEPERNESLPPAAGTG